MRSFQSHFPFCCALALGETFCERGELATESKLKFDFGGFKGTKKNFLIQWIVLRVSNDFFP
jgi:hypothetical protein